MCNHNMVKVNDLNVCVKCGLILADGKKVVFDRRLSDFVKNRSKKRRKSK